MREVETDRFVAAPPAAVARALTPERVVEAEGSFTVRETREEDGATLVAAGRRGVGLLFRFEEREDGLEYEQIEGPLATLTTTLTYRAEDEGTRLTARSSVEASGPGLLDRLAAWKRKGELKRALATLADEA
ncbi:SRPBCC family protein [Halosegnis marinus]|uniref:SRPBCC family protein n=1 Tax=Halosegnis marinus TaxID=3034023 RepID=A0ABD5ZPH7_9EURY|nr:SRPBCC family protein [Halosegnis sp. DT85]